MWPDRKATWPELLLTVALGLMLGASVWLVAGTPHL